MLEDMGPICWRHRRHAHEHPVCWGIGGIGPSTLKLVGVGELRERKRVSQ